MESSSCYRYNTAKEYTATLKSLSDVYHTKLKKYRRRITAIDITVYSVSGMLASAGVVLSSVTMIAPIVVPIVLSAVTTIAGVITAITKKISSCSQTKLHTYSSKYAIVNDAHSLLSSMISLSLNDEIITDDEFVAIVAVYKSAMSKLEEFQLENFPLKIQNNNNDDVTRITPADS